MINELAKHDGCKDALVNAGIIPILLNVMQGHAGNPHVQAQGLKCLATLCANSTSIQSGLYPGQLLNFWAIWVNHGKSVVPETSRPGNFFLGAWMTLDDLCLFYSCLIPGIKPKAFPRFSTPSVPRPTLGPRMRAPWNSSRRG